MKQQCSGLVGRIFGHKFRPVVTLGAPTVGVTGQMCEATAIRILNNSKPEVFHGCICQRCGAEAKQGAR